MTRDNNYEERLRELYREVRTQNEVIGVLRGEIIKMAKRIEKLEGGVRPSLVPPHPEPSGNP